MKENIKIIGNPVGYEVDQEKTKMLLKKKILPIKQWKDLVDNKISVGNSVYIISSSSIIVDYSGTRRFNEYDKDCFIDRNYANASMALSQISQLMPYYGGKVTNEEWNDGKISKYCIERKFDGRGAFYSCDKVFYRYLSYISIS